MPTRAPHFLLKAESRRQNNRTGNWHFVLQTADGRKRVDAEDAEPALPAERLELLAVVRGLEAIDSPAKVTLQTSSSYVRRGINYGLDDWRENNWHWEWHGKMVPVKNGDLWRRLDRALQVHDVDCQILRIDTAHAEQTEVAQSTVDSVHSRSRTQCVTTDGSHLTKSHTLPSVARHQTDLNLPAPTRRPAQRKTLACRRWWREAATTFRLRLAQLGTNLLPKPWLE